MKATILATACALALGFSALAAAQDNTAGQASSETTQQMPRAHETMGKHAGKHHRMGAHSMTVKVTSVDKTTGIVHAGEGDHALVLHFPPASLANVSAGDSIVVHLSFSMAK